MKKYKIFWDNPFNIIITITWGLFFLFLLFFFGIKPHLGTGNRLVSPPDTLIFETTLYGVSINGENSDTFCVDVSNYTGSVDSIYIWK